MARNQAAFFVLHLGTRLEDLLHFMHSDVALKYSPRNQGIGESKKSIAWQIHIEG